MRAPMNLIRAGLGHDVDNTTSGSSEFGAERIGLNFELLNGVDHGHVGGRVEQGCVGRTAVDEGFVCEDLAAVSREVALVVGIGSRRNTAERPDRLCARCQPDQGQRIPADHRKIGNLAIVNHPVRVTKCSAAAAVSPQ
jgi:hypothetical protein